MDNLVWTDDSPIDNWFIEKDYLTNLSLNSFTPVTIVEVIRSLNKLPTKSCELDPANDTTEKGWWRCSPTPNFIYQWINKHWHFQ